MKKKKKKTEETIKEPKRNETPGSPTPKKMLKTKWETPQPLST